MSNNKPKTTVAKSTTHNVVTPLLEAMYGEFKELSRKKPESAVSKKKLLVANRLLTRIREVLADEQEIEFLDLLNEDDVPEVSDVTLVFSQYVAAMKAFKEKYSSKIAGEDIWHTT